ncbi:CubicO group peptidase (beta-lactamase class C family) [Haloferula luteola]|uniref:CubicO group peptidase (Beta-lactamase class C family) n=1 Tax=Haloferula luteola TaxID=595692 RepID=A0A840V5R3_9BACT|nr:serine hydrolase domain-containing protein [Haloferula luteola]MBB5352973.1 CubicO group peptidase (beta-lactamase class C family) [Haloferula luteola]
MKTLTALALSTLMLHAQPLLEPATQAVEEALRLHEVAGAVTLVSQEGEIRHLSSQGAAHLENGTPMREDALFWIASMSKPITAAAVMQQVEAGKLDLDASIDRYLPEFKDLKGPDGQPATITLRQCLTHTSGMKDLEAGEGADLHTLAELTARIGPRPLDFTPGSQWRYCQTSINTAARAVEVASGESFPDYLEKHLFGPLGMRDTTFYPNEEQASRLATSYERQEDGSLRAVPLSFLFGKPVTSHDRYPRGNGGLFSTARDYHRFALMLLGQGELEGHRCLSPESVEAMSSVQTADLQTGFTPGNGWGIGCCVIQHPQGITAALSQGSFGHGGAYGTQVWIDPAKQRVFLLLVQRSNFPNSDGSNLRQAFQNAAAKALE